MYNSGDLEGVGDTNWIGRECEHRELKWGRRKSVRLPRGGGVVRERETRCVKESKDEKRKVGWSVIGTRIVIFVLCHNLKSALLLNRRRYLYCKDDARKYCTVKTKKENQHAARKVGAPTRPFRTLRRL